MGSKNNPGKFDCYNNALPDEPTFVLLARDPSFRRLVEAWATQRFLDIKEGTRPASDMELVEEAKRCAGDGEKWRRDNYGKWRPKP